MKYIIAILSFLSSTPLLAQAPTNNLVEGGKLFIELVKVFKKPQANQNQLAVDKWTIRCMFC